MQTHRRLHWCLVLVLFAAVLAPPRLAQAGSTSDAGRVPASAAPAPRAQATFPDDDVWSRWGAEQTVLVEEGGDLWIGAGTGVLRWNIATETATRYTTVDGLPSYRIYAVAVDGAGNRWFGGDGGLSRLDAGGAWTHFTSTNSGLHDDAVVGIAVGADDTLWLAHGLPDGSVSRRDADGSWHWTPNRSAAVVNDYAAIVQTRNVNPLWTVSGSEVWVDFAVYNGAQWVDRTPSGSAGRQPDAIVASATEVWALFSDISIYRWTGTGWQIVGAVPPDLPNGGFSPTALVVAGDGRLWIGGRLATCIKGCIGTVTVFPADNPAASRTVSKATAVTSMLSTASGVWAIGPGWLLPPQGDVFTIDDIPTGDTVEQAITGGDGLLWLSSNSYRYNYTNATAGTQSLDDNASSVFTDDAWEMPFPGKTIYAAERTPGGDVWLELWLESIYDDLCPSTTLVRRYQQAWVEVQPAYLEQCGRITDIFAQDERHTWFAYIGRRHPDGTAVSGVMHLDDNGTPATLSDDHWTNYPFPSLHISAYVAVNDALWLATYDGLFRWQDNQWVVMGDSATRYYCDLTVAGEEVLLAHRDPLSSDCGYPAVQVSVIRPSAAGLQQQVYDSVDEFLRLDWELAQQAVHRNPLFDHAGGAVWYFGRDDLCRRTEDGVDCVQLPESMTDMSQVEVDGTTHVWFAGNGALWRLAQRPGFALQPATALLWMTPSSTSRSTIFVRSVEGFEGSVALAVSSVPGAFGASVAPAVAPTGLAASLTITATAAAAPGVYRVSVQGVGIGATGLITRSAAVDIRVAEENHQRYMPLVFRP